jgi:transcriptional regulator with XRE-family HTH domain
MSATKAKEIFSFAELRKRLGFNQAEMANRMGLGARTYWSLEENPGSINVRHAKLAEMVALELAVERQDASLAPPRVADLARAFAAIGKRKIRLI